MTQKKIKSDSGSSTSAAVAAAKKKRVRGAAVAQGETAALSGMDYAIVAGALTGVGVVLLVLLAVLAPRLVPAEILDQFFYIVLLVWGLVCALVLFGVMKSYARVTYKHLGGAIEIGGPAAFAALVVLGGFWLVPRPGLLVLTLRPHGLAAPVITSGKIRLEVGNLQPLSSDIGSDGEAVFKVPHAFWHTEIKVLPQVTGYKQEYQTLLIDRNVFDLNFSPVETILKGIIKPAPDPGQKIKILIAEEKGEAVPDADGRFEFLVHKTAGEPVRVSVCSDGKRIYDDVVYLEERQVEIKTREPDVACGS